MRYYEGAGVMPKPARGANGYRLYGTEDVRRLGFVLRARHLGLSVADVRDLLALVDGERVDCGEVRAATLAHLAAVRTRIKYLQRLEHTLADISARCSGDAVPDCPVIDALMNEEFQ